MQADKNDVALGTIGILENTQHFDLHGFRLDALKHGVGDSAHSGMDLRYRNSHN